MSPVPPPGPRLENRLPSEGINASDEHPLREFAWLVGAGLAALLVAVLVIGAAASWLAPRVPFEDEQALAARLEAASSAPARPAAHRERDAALQALADRVAARMALPPGMTVVLRYEDGGLVNAYATLGGRIHVFRGLLRELRSEDALAALLAHEIAHVKHRHVAAGLGRGLALGVLLSALSADAGAMVAQSVLGQAAGLALLGYSREQEAQADDEALRAVAALYGHAGGVTELFARLEAATRGNGPAIELLRSHPLTPDRLQRLRDEARRQGIPLQGTPVPLPAALRVAD